MGFEDRDWYRQEHRQRRYTKPIQKRSRLQNLLALLALTIIGYCAYALNSNGSLERLANKWSHAKQRLAQNSGKQLVQQPPVQQRQIIYEYWPAETSRTPAVNIYNNYQIERLAPAEANRLDNQRRIREIEQRDKNCRYWRSYGIDYPLEVIHENISRYCR